MKKIDLNGIWQMREEGAEASLQTQIPGSVAATLLNNKIIDDPYYGSNEERIQDIFDKNYEFFREFYVDEKTLLFDKVLLCCEGLDTLAKITVNGRILASTDNMHRTWIFDVKEYLSVGKNTISILFFSPVEYTRQHPSKTGKRFAVLRKAACMFGWDWGLSLPDSGIWRDIYISVFNHAAISHTEITQKHTKDSVRLSFTLFSKIWSEDVSACAELFSPQGEKIYSHTAEAKSSTAFFTELSAPQLWWPAGYGEQPLYTLKIRLFQKDTVLDELIQRIGLRSITLNRDKRPDGSNYGFIVNGIPIFFKGENLIIDDAIISRTTNERWDRLLDNCIRSNLNGIRVWGGAYFPPDYFYERCDRLGLLIWQDFMFACTFYWPSDSFIENARAEISDNLKRIAHHASLALLCGNNEIESIYTVMKSKEPETTELRKLFGREERAGLLLRKVLRKIYGKVFLKLIPSLCKEFAPQTAYAHSSPSTRRPWGAKSFFDYLNDGDMHYYLQYNGNAPYQKLRTVKCRFMTEMGFQSYPSIKSISSFCKKEEQSPYSAVMLSHQKCKNGNEAIELYMERDYGVPKDFEDYIYLSQLQAGEIMRYSVEHLRRLFPYCNGMIIWQLNDCWPAVSWSGIDYYGRWKAQQYYTKRFYEPSLLSALDNGKAIELWVTNNRNLDTVFEIIWSLHHIDGTVKRSGKATVYAQPNESKAHLSLDFSTDISDSQKDSCYFSYFLRQGEREYGHGTVLFCLPKEFNFAEPTMAVDVKEEPEEYLIHISASTFIKGLALDTTEGDCIFSDNFFDLSCGEKRTVHLKKTDVAGIASVEELRKNLYIRCLNSVLKKQK